MQVHAMLAERLRSVQIPRELLTCDREDKSIEQRLDSERGIRRWFAYGVMSLDWPIGEWHVDTGHSYTHCRLDGLQAIARSKLPLRCTLVQDRRRFGLQLQHLMREYRFTKAEYPLNT